MRAVYIKEFGGTENLEVREVPDPRPPGPGEVLVRVLNAGLNRADLLQLRGLYPPPEGYDPRIPGLEFAGRVIQTGEGVAELKANDRVFGITAGGGQAEYLVVDQRLLALVPDHLDTWDAAAVPEAYVTAQDALVTQAGLKAGETVLIHAIASGVGIASAQIAKHAGAFVIGTSRSPEKLARFAGQASMSRMSVDETIATTNGPSFSGRVNELTEGKGADVIIDLVGGPYFEENIRCAAPKARIMLVGLTAGRKSQIDMGVVLAKRLTIKGTVLRSRSVEEKGETMDSFRRSIVPGLSLNGPFWPEVDRYFEFDDVARAYEHLASNRSFGKVVLNLAS
ncbi:MAG TPA: NAD(P)H-quinone oxidoreductase [Pyrinomonadaceae bacterium]|nr:NAD(P)H-quinone oxidoreductase [Pyrinomonadaceae bacterium]HMP66475.1 NAD(P)H-quinone oxidoreductase [Pyrinomonadaceae bacterium]